MIVSITTNIAIKSNYLQYNKHIKNAALKTI